MPGVYITDATTIDVPPAFVQGAEAQSKGGEMPQVLATPLRTSQMGQARGNLQIELPPRIPGQCVEQSAVTYRLNPFILVAVLKVESNGRTGVISTNKNGSKDLGPAQLNTNSWGSIFETKYKISRDALVNDMCQSIRAMAFALRSEIDWASGNLWEGVGNYHSHTKLYHDQYIDLVHNAYKTMVKKGAF
jgi:hypothetical protein